MADDIVFAPLGAAKREIQHLHSEEESSAWTLAANWSGNRENHGHQSKKFESGNQQTTKHSGLQITDPSDKSPQKRKALAIPPLIISSLSHHAVARKPPRSPTKSPAGSVATPSNHSSLGDDGSSGQARSPGAMLRMQSATTVPAPHPISELTRLTSQRHLVPMTRVIHSMASLSRAGYERSQKKTNQDSCFAFRQYVEPYQAIAAILDGHGPNGHLVSNFIKQKLPMIVAEQLRQKGQAAAPAALRAAFLEMQSSLRSAQGAINSRLSGSTAVVSLIQGRRITTAWVGDSRAIILRREGSSMNSGGNLRGIALTQDHKPTSAAELSRILAAGGRVERLSDGCREVGPQRVWLPGSWVPGLAMSRALGDFVAQSVGVIAEPEVNTHELDPNDEFLVVASDGVWEFMSMQEVAETVESCESAEEACKALVDVATQKWNLVNDGIIDDISVVVAKLLFIR